MIKGEETSKIDFDSFLEKIGEYGKYQRIRFYLICVALSFYQPIASYQLIFMFSTPEGYRCQTADENSTRFIISNKSNIDELCNFQNFTNNLTISESCDRGYVYEFLHEPRESLVTEWDLVCGNRWIVSTTFLFGTIGQSAALLILSYLADSFGRSVTFFFSLILFLPLNLVKIWLPSWKWLAAIHFFASFVGRGMFQIPWIYCLEIVGPSERTFVCFVMCTAYALGSAAMALIGMALITIQARLCNGEMCFK